jgi:nitrogen fixation/metabolism regulation signal transduction histidine kinase
MLFSNFKFKVVSRVLILGILLTALIYLIQQPGKVVSSVILAGLVLLSVSELVRFVSQTNRKLTRFLESVKYGDFISAFSVDNDLGDSFSDLNAAFNEVLEAFRKARSEKEEHWQYLNTVIQHVSTGLLSFDAAGTIQLINTVTKRFFQIHQLQNIKELEERHPGLYLILTGIEAGKNAMCRVDERTNLAIHATKLRMRGEAYTLVALQNIQTELQQKEIESWQNLTRVLRHEIMNSMTPIVSLTSTLNDILTEELEEKDGHFELSTEGVDDINDGLNTIRSRSKALINFIDAYREYTSIPSPNIETLSILELIEDVTALLKVDIRRSGVALTCESHPAGLQVSADSELIEQVLINLIKNAVEAVGDNKDGQVQVRAGHDPRGNVFISVQDNGEGILPEAMERVFIPFYTTKKTGSGIGLALSRQIMQLHNGTLTVDSRVNHKTIFTMRF